MFKFKIKIKNKSTYALLGIAAGLLVMQACSREVPSEIACNFVQNQNVQRVSWEQNLPVNLYYDNSVPVEYEAAMNAAIARWNAVGQQLIGKDFFRIRGGSPGSSTPVQDGYSKIYVLNTWEANKTSEQARTTVYWTGTRIYEADVRVNDKDFDYYMTDTPDYRRVHLESLIVHELGHVLGLAHTSTAESVMQAHLANGTERDQPSSIDLSSLSCEY